MLGFVTLDWLQGSLYTSSEVCHQTLKEPGRYPDGGNLLVQV
jgi:hypothetical protein